MSKVSNCFKMLELLSLGRVFSISEIANYLEVSPRMIRQYKMELEIAGVYISSIRGMHGGYYLDLSSIYPVRGISKDDLKILLKALSSSDQEARHVVHKIETLILEEDISVGDKRKYSCFSKAMNEGKLIKLIYHSSKGNIRERIVEPLDFLVYNKTWYLLGYCQTKKGLRRFRFSGIEKYEIFISD